jgi:polyisoprenoid-binding protein YceI
MGKNIRHLLAVSVLMAGFVLSPKLYAEVYTIDKAHSNVAFTTTHLMVSRVSGHFADYDGVINFDPNNLEASKIDITIKADSIDTNNEKRDGHLKSEDFFDTGKFPEIKFVSKKIEKAGDKYNVIGDLTIKDVTKEVTIPAEIAGPVKSPMGGEAIGINANTKINRQDYGVKWNKALDSGGMMVSDDVDINVSFEANMKEESKEAVQKEETK